MIHLRMSFPGCKFCNLGTIIQCLIVMPDIPEPDRTVICGFKYKPVGLVHPSLHDPLPPGLQLLYLQGGVTIVL